MNTAERNLLKEGYHYSLYESDKEKMKERSKEERAKGFLVRTMGNRLYTKYKALKPAEIPAVQKSYEDSIIEIANKTSVIEKMESELKELQSRIFAMQNEKRKTQELAADLKRKLKDSGITINTQN